MFRSRAVQIMTHSTKQHIVASEPRTSTIANGVRLWKVQTKRNELHNPDNYTINVLKSNLWPSELSPDLNALHEEMKPLGLTILGFPCNQFGKQEPGERHEIMPGLT